MRILVERWKPQKDRIEQIPSKRIVSVPYRNYFIKRASFMQQIFRTAGPEGEGRTEKDDHGGTGENGIMFCMRISFLSNYRCPMRTLISAAVSLGEEYGRELCCSVQPDEGAASYLPLGGACV